MVAVVIALAPILAVMVVVVATVQTATAVGAVPEEFVAVAVPTAVVPIVAAATAASNCFVEVSVAAEGQQLAQRELCDHCECAARCTTPRGSPTR